MKKMVVSSLTVLALVLSFAQVSSASATSSDVIAKKSKSEPTPKDKDERKGGEEAPDSREETYEGNDRGGGSFDGGGYEGGSGGMGSEVFYAKSVSKKLGNNVRVEDRGEVLVYTEITQEDIDASETCSTITRTVVDKASGKVLSQDSSEFCNRWPL